MITGKVLVGLAVINLGMQSFMAAFQVPTGSGGVDTHTILSVFAVANGLLSVSVLASAMGLAYGYGKLNQTVEIQGRDIEKLTGEFTEEVKALRADIQQKSLQLAQLKATIKSERHIAFEDEE